MEVGLPDDLPAAEGLLAAENRFHLLIESVQDYAIFMVDPNGIVLSWNAGAQRLKGYTADEIIGQSFEVFYPAQAVADGWPREELRLSAADGRVEDEGWRIRRDGSRFWASVVITALRDPAGRLLGHAKVTRDLTERRLAERAARHLEGAQHPDREIRSTTPGAAATTVVPGGVAKSVPLWLSYVRSRPRKSRTRGSATFTRRSRNSNIRSPRSVTRTPIGMFSRSLKLEIAFFDFVATAF